MQVEEFKGFHQDEGWFLTWVDGVEVVANRLGEGRADMLPDA